MWWRELEAQQGAWAKSGHSKEPLSVDPLAIIDATAVLDTTRGPITIGAWTRICPGAHLVGPLEIGSDCLVGNLAMIRGPASIGNGTRIGFATEIKNAIIAENVTIGPQCFIADSKLETGVYLGAQVRTSNHRLDKKNVTVMVDGEAIDTGLEKLGCLIGANAALGIQVIVLPGRVIAPDSIFAPRVTVDKNLPTGRYRHVQQLEAF
jgi:UDP-N-acetylglucosamine diphosphorylase / glucose-1-phosphate thymidylyltransferase / UDP-N-acetylgalactosamine diphosphorylase / glucosamine-1-phosphate N-acetyltransferase / galactosamine-1-phosphate N-acetyltransferase